MAIDHPPTQYQIETCLPDAIRLCSDVPLNLEAIRACLNRQKTTSNACKKALKEK